MGIVLKCHNALSALRVVGIDVATAGEISAGHADDYFIFDDKRRRRDGVGFFEIADRDVPDDGAGFPVESHEMRVQRAHVQAVAEDPESSIHRATTYRRDEIGRQSAAISPDWTARPPINRPGLIVVSGNVQNAVDDERRVLNAAPGEAGDIGLENPLRNKSRHVLRRQLFQWAVPLPSVIARKGQPA